MTQFSDDVQVDGNLRVGDDPGATNALVEARRDPASTGKPKRGLQVSGEVVDENGDPVNWSVHELTLNGSGSATQVEAAALRSTLFVDGSQNLNTGVGVDIQVEQPPSATGTLDEAIGLRVADINDGTENFAIKTGEGVVQFGDTLELEAPTVVPGTPATDTVRIYPKTDSKLYAKTDDGTEYLLTGSQGGTVEHTHENTAEGGQLNASNVFNAGVLPHERGGLEADVSAFSGLLKIAGGATSQAVAGTDYTTPTGSQALSNKTITGSSINSTPVGASVPSTGNFSTLNVSGGVAFTQSPGAGKVLTSDVAGNASWQTLGFDLIAQFLTNSNVASFQISSIPSGYKALLLVLRLRSDLVNAVGDNILLQFNGDTSNAYRSYNTYVNKSGTSGATDRASLAKNAILCGFASATNSPLTSGVAYHYGIHRIFIMDYAANSYKETMTEGFVMTTLDNPFQQQGGGIYAASGALWQIKIFPESGFNWVAGSSYNVYGLK